MFKSDVKIICRIYKIGRRFKYDSFVKSPTQQRRSQYEGVLFYYGDLFCGIFGLLLILWFLYETVR